jgi:hypothetical protein
VISLALIEGVDSYLVNKCLIVLCFLALQVICICFSVSFFCLNKL